MKAQVQRIVERGGLRSIEQGSTKQSMISNLYERKYINLPKQSRLTVLLPLSTLWETAYVNSFVLMVNEDRSVVLT